MQVNRPAQPTNTESILRANRAAENNLIADALDRVAMPMPSVLDRIRAHEPGYIAVPVGTEVYRGGMNEPETVIGTRGNQLITGRMNPETGHIAVHTAPFDSYAKYSQSLMSSPATMDGWTGAQLTRLNAAPDASSSASHHLWAPTYHSIESVAAFGDDATVRLRNISEAASPANPDVELPWSTWRSSIRQSEALTPIAVPPTSAEQVANLRWLVGDKHIVVSAAGQHNRLPYFDRPESHQPSPAVRERVIGTDTVPGERGKPVLDHVNNIQRFFREKVGSDVMPASREIVATTDVPDNLANASAGILDRGRAQLNLGPGDTKTADSWLQEIPSEARRDYRKVNQLLRDFNTEVLAHEGGHIHQFDEWGIPGSYLGNDVNTRSGRHRMLQHGRSKEAFSDLAGFASTGKPDVGVRQLGRLTHRFPDLPRMLEIDASLPMSHWGPHTGTQLITAPMVRFGLDRGPDELAEVLGAATRQIGTDLREGRYEVADIPHSASALHEAAARRLGADHPSVAALRDGWDKLGVPLRDANFSSWGEPRARVHGGSRAIQSAKIGEELGVQQSLDALDRVSSQRHPSSADVRELTRIRNSDAGRRALLTAPVAQLGREHGWHAVNAITSDARQTLGAQLREGRFDTVRVPDAARALHEATERHFGALSAPAEHVAAGYQAIWSAESLAKIARVVR